MFLCSVFSLLHSKPTRGQVKAQGPVPVLFRSAPVADAAKDAHSQKDLEDLCVQGVEGLGSRFQLVSGSRVWGLEST